MNDSTITENTSATGNEEEYDDDAAPFTDVMPAEGKPEIVIGLVSPIGIELEPLISALTSVLSAANYSTTPIRLSDSIQEVFGIDCKTYPEHERIELLMNAGTMLREKSRCGDAVAWLGVEQIALHRKHSLGSKVKENAYILRSLKHPAEVERLRAIYGRGFILVSAYAPREFRVNTLAERFSRSRLGDESQSRAHAERLIEKDETEFGKKLGQDVKDAFPLADFFVDVRHVDGVKSEVQRFLELFFGYRFHTPTRDEHGMYHARSAALRSADLNRQVGAAILTETGDVLTVGCNDVPKAGGDQYWPGDAPDARDFKRGYDSSARQRKFMLEEALGRLKQAKLLAETAETEDIEALVKQLTVGDRIDVLKGAALMNLLEFGRSVHAEMAAITSAARLGIPLKGSTLFTTTFPCHMCARHIVASGIMRVVYIEPYPKSRAKQLHDDSIAVDPATPSQRIVNFEPFQGIAPRQYQLLFDAADLRKQGDGNAVEWSIAGGQVRFQRYLNTYFNIETQITGSFIKSLRELGKKYRSKLLSSLNKENLNDPS
ncbi:anti-phage dCTP deaminase [Variovorax defluvii]|uniref:Anti-phage dCTP deaminase n=1 Tax=Variovorax defluvii TaxID=913761 RepID=A0ABP8HR31_9BURK